MHRVPKLLRLEGDTCVFTSRGYLCLYISGGTFVFTFWGTYVFTSGVTCVFTSEGAPMSSHGGHLCLLFVGTCAFISEEGTCVFTSGGIVLSYVVWHLCLHISGAPLSSHLGETMSLHLRGAPVCLVYYMKSFDRIAWNLYTLTFVQIKPFLNILLNVLL